jgi:hypothetical protein
MSVWTNLGVNPFCYSRIVKINDVLYAFGCFRASAHCTNIYSTAWNNPTGWTDTGVSVPGFAGDGCVAILNNTIYNYVGYVSGSHVLTAPVSNPLSWTDTGIDIPNYTSDNCAFIVTPTHVCMCGGYRSPSAVNNTSYASIGAPTTFAITAAAGVTGWQQGGCYLDGDLAYVFGGYNPSPSVTGNMWAFSARDPTVKQECSSLSMPAYNVDQNAAVFHVEDRVYVTGNANANLYYTSASNLYTPWDAYPNVMPGNVGYPQSNWIGPDGYAYLILHHATAPSIYRSGRKKIYLLDSPKRDGTYADIRAVTESGGKSAYTVHCQMGMAPWYTNRRDKF